MSESGDKSTEKNKDLDAQQQEIADVQEELDARADGDGLAAEAGSGEEMGLSEG